MKKTYLIIDLDSVIYTNFKEGDRFTKSGITPTAKLINGLHQESMINKGLIKRKS